MVAVEHDSVARAVVSVLLLSQPVGLSTSVGRVGDVTDR